MNKNQAREIISVDDIGKIDINFPEFCFGVIGKTKPKDQPETITYQLKNNPENKITIIRSGMGFPDQTTRDLIHALMRITFKKNRFQSNVVPTTLSEIFQELGWSKNGKSNLILKRHLNILLTTGINFESSFFDKYQKKFHDSISFGILSYFWFREIKSDGSFSKPPENIASDCEKGYFAWNEKFFEQSIKSAKNLIDFDYSMYLSFGTDITKQLYLFLSKRRYGTQTLRMPLGELAFTVLGISSNMSNKLFKVRQMLRNAHKQLISKGFLSAEPIFEKGRDKTEYVVYNFKYVNLVFSHSTQEIIGLESPDNDNSLYAQIKAHLGALGATDGQIAKLIRKYPENQLHEAVQQITLQYGDKKKIRNLIGLIKIIIEDGGDTSLAQEQDIKLREAEERRKEAEELQKQKELEARQKAEEQARLETKIDAWIGANMLEFLKMADFFVENRVKSNPVLKMFMEKEMERTGVNQSMAVMSHPSLRSLLREEVGEIILKESTK